MPLPLPHHCLGDSSSAFFTMSLSLAAPASSRANYAAWGVESRAVKSGLELRARRICYPAQPKCRFNQPTNQSIYQPIQPLNVEHSS